LSEDDVPQTVDAFAEACEPPGPPSEPRLLAVVEGQVTSFVLPRQPVVSIGRLPGADVLLDAASVSRRHALLRAGPPLTIEDLGSNNGTWVRNARLAPQRPAPLAPGEVFRLGTIPAWVEQRRPAAASEPRPGPDLPVISSPRMRALHELLQRIAAAPIDVLIVGETGAGKEVLARAVHAGSPRRHGPFLALNCSALSETLLESELFGHEKGAFTGAVGAKAGLLESAQGGTILLDELGEMPLSVQAKLLRVLEERRVLRVGSLQPRPIDVRFVAATNRDLGAEVEAGRFRKDLYYRLDGATLVVPPLRERREEIEPLARHYAGLFAAELGRTSPTLSPAALAALLAHDWPGNVRELKNAVRLAVVLCGDAPVEPEHLRLGVGAAFSDRSSAAGPALPPAPRGAPPATSYEPAGERERILEALARCGGSQTRAAEALGISRRTLTRRLTELDLPRPRRGAE
jgi:DNA-binding NtrC family response regulator